MVHVPARETYLGQDAAGPGRRSSLRLVVLRAGRSAMRRRRGRVLASSVGRSAVGRRRLCQLWLQCSWSKLWCLERVGVSQETSHSSSRLSSSLSPKPARRQRSARSITSPCLLHAPYASTQAALTRASSGTASEKRCSRCRRDHADPAPSPRSRCPRPTRHRCSRCR